VIVIGALILNDVLLNTIRRELGKLTSDDGSAGDFFGYSASISGNTMVAGVYLDDSYRARAMSLTNSVTQPLPSCNTFAGRERREKGDSRWR